MKKFIASHAWLCQIIALDILSQSGKKWRRKLEDDLKFEEMKLIDGFLDDLTNVILNLWISFNN